MSCLPPQHRPVQRWFTKSQKEEAFELARDVGVDVLTQPGGLRNFVSRLRDVVFPRASEGACEPVRMVSLCCRTFLDDDGGGSYLRLTIRASS